MITNYLLIAIRNLLKSKVLTLINVGGLTLGISCCLLAALYIHQELTFDRFHEDADDIYRVAFDNYNTEGPYATTPLPVGPALAEEFTAVKASTRVHFLDDFLIRHQDNSFFEQLTIVDSSFFKVFSFALLRGNPSTALAKPNQIVLTEATAKKYFGDEDPIGKMLLVGSSGSFNSIVTGVVANPPGNSQLQFDFLLSFLTIEKLGWPTSLWFQMPNNFTYIKLNENSSPHTLAELFPGFVKKYVGDQLKGSYESMYQMSLQPLTEIHLTSHREKELPTQGSEAAIYLFASIAGIILVIACINYINLTTALNLKRAREMGVRKVAGANRSQLVQQLLSESIVVSIISGVMAFVITDLVLPYFNQLVSVQLTTAHLMAPFMLVICFSLLFISSIGAGLLPALYLAKVNIVRSLKGISSFSSTGLVLRKGLVVFQFFSAIFLLTATLVVFQQIDFIRASLYPHGADEQVVVFPINSKIARSIRVVENQLMASAGIHGVSASSSVPGFNRDSWPVRTSLDGPSIRTENYVVDEQYVDVMAYRLLAGRNFSQDIASDSSAFVINEKAVHQFGFETPEGAIGQSLYWGSENPKQGIVIGVIQDFNFSTYRDEIIPALLQLNTPDWNQFVSVRLSMNNFTNSIDELKKSISSIDENWIVDYHFMDENFEQLHQRDIVQGKLFGIFSTIAIIISCMGLLGLAIFSTAQRSKEMGIRKTLGASSFGLMMMVLKDFVLLFVIAYFIALPISFYSINQWLDGFAYHTSLSASIYLMTAALVLLALFMTVGYQTIKIARVNPVDSLKSE